ncbi:hypothetical protein F53441_276 [Fusarium austroafricanum]|uniref:Uncharacterized protein n=1 Tax=Fusarium austroafricanum TaxID=2364996 RepID=A0A8H4P5D0_9HYPO|nr:hypothetical protein F53441_276 [Fusarium austroafricanum]
MAWIVSRAESIAPPSFISSSDRQPHLIGMVYDNMVVHSDCVESPELPASSGKPLVEELRASEAKVRALKAQVRDLKAELTALRRQVSPEHPLPIPESLQLPHEAFTVAFHIENPRDYPIERKINDEDSPELRKFLKQLPKTEEDWCQRRKIMQLSSPETVTRTFLDFITRTQSQEAASKIQVESRSLTDEAVLRNYGQFVDSLQKDDTRAHQISNFATLLFVCLCRVAREQGVCLEIVDELLDDFLPRKTKKEKRHSGHLRHLRTEVLWPISQTELLRTKLAHRADEFFLLYGPPINTYERLWRDKGSKIFADLAKLPPLPVTREPNADVLFSIPLMIKLIAGRSFR